MGGMDEKGLLPPPPLKKKQKKQAKLKVLWVPLAPKKCPFQQKKIFAFIENLCLLQRVFS